MHADHGVKMNESEKIDKHLDLARELKKPWNMKVAVKPIVGTTPKGLERKLKKL